MSDAEIEKINNSAGTGAPNFTYGLNSGGSDSGLLGFAYTASGSEPSSPANGDVWFDTANDKYYTYINGEFKQLTHVNAAPAFSWGGARGVFMGREMQNTIDYVDIQNSGNATDFGDITASRYQAMGFGNATKGLIAGGRNSSYAAINNIEQVTISTTANATDFGDLTQTQRAGGGWSNGTRGGVCGGQGGTASNVISYVTIDTAGNATDHGDLNYSPNESDAINDATHCVSGGGFDLVEYAQKNTLDYFTMATTGNASDFGDLTTTRSNLGGADDGTYGLFYGGSAPSVNYSNVIEYITVASTGNGTDFGDLTVARSGAKGCGDGTYAVFGGGYTGSHSNVVDRVTVATTGNASDHGDLTVVGQHPAAVSGNAS